MEVHPTSFSYPPTPEPDRHVEHTASNRDLELEKEECLNDILQKIKNQQFYPAQLEYTVFCSTYPEEQENKNQVIQAFFYKYIALADFRNAWELIKGHWGVRSKDCQFLKLKGIWQDALVIYKEQFQPFTNIRKTAVDETALHKETQIMETTSSTSSGASMSAILQLSDSRNTSDEYPASTSKGDATESTFDKVKFLEKIQQKIQQRKLFGAELACEIALIMKPTDEDIVAIFVRVLIQRGDFKKSLEICNQVWGVRSENTTFLKVQMEWQKALKEQTPSTSSSSEKSVVTRDKIFTMINKGQYRNAIELLKTQRVTEENLWLLGRVYLAQCKYKKAGIFADKILQISPENIQAFCLKSRANVHSPKKAQKVLKLARECLKISKILTKPKSRK